MLHICLVDNIQIILSVGKLYCHITVTDMLLGQIPIPGVPKKSTPV